MAKIVKKKKEKKPFPLYIFLLILLGAFYCGWSVFINTYKVNLTKSIQEKQNRINEMKAENKRLEDQIAVLGNKETIFAFADQEGLELNLDNVIRITNEVE